VSELPVIETPTGGDTPRGETQSARVHGVLLAAGTSSRFGEENKLLATVEEKPIVRHAAETLLEADLAVTVVLGHERERVRDALGDLDVVFVEAENYAAGQSQSLRRGIEAVQNRRQAVDAVLIALGDMPDVSAATVDRLRATYETARRSALATAYEGQRGNPVLFDAKHFDALTATDGDTGGRAVLLSAEDAALVETGDPGVVRDVDLPGDLTERR
jgi:molybdenum cofactor cytidylyltransferase